MNTGHLDFTKGQMPSNSLCFGTITGVTGFQISWDNYFLLPWFPHLLWYQNEKAGWPEHCGQAPQEGVTGPHQASSPVRTPGLWTLVPVVLLTRIWFGSSMSSVSVLVPLFSKLGEVEKLLVLGVLGFNSWLCHLFAEALANELASWPVVLMIGNFFPRLGNHKNIDSWCKKGPSRLARRICTFHRWGNWSPG